MSHYGFAACVLGCVLQSFAMAQDADLPHLLYRESFETGLAPGEKGDLGDTGWDLGNSTLENAGIWHPTTAAFPQATPLAAPAEGNQVLFIDDFEGTRDNTFMAVNTGIVLQDGGTYRITAATGHPLGGIGDQSIQAWIQPPPLDGGIDRRGFVGQSFTTYRWEEAEPGEWVINAFELTAFDGEFAFNPATGAADLPIVGSELIILVTNFNSDCCGNPGGQPGIVVWDDFRVLSDVPPQVITPGDFNGDGRVDVADIDLLNEAVLAGSEDLRFDLDEDGSIDGRDRSFWVTQIVGTWFGDANLDGRFNSSDLVTVFQAGQYEDSLAGNSSWATGDWNGNGDFESGDLVTAFQDGGFEQGPRAAAHAVPEPNSLLFCLMMPLCWMLTNCCQKSMVAPSKSY